MKIFNFILACILSVISGNAQSFQEISTGQGYNKQSFIRISNGTEKQVNNDSWDLAFTAFGFQDAGIFINESAGSVMGQNLPLTELYYAQTNDFNASVDIESIKTQKYLNSEKSWSYGAFNELRDTLNPFDYGWGQYIPGANKVLGNKVFVMKLRNGSYKKIKIESLTGTIYNFTYADLDGSNQVTKTLNKLTDNKGQKLIFFSFATNATVDVLPQGGFDLMYCRYITLAKDPNGTIVQQYNVTGVLTGPGVLTAEADSVDFVSANYENYKNRLSAVTDIIGYDWKTLSGTSWVIDPDKVFFVKTADNQVWKIHFIDFEGAATGTAVFQKENIGTMSSADNMPEIKVGVFPNPVSDRLIISASFDQSAKSGATIHILDASGVNILSRKVTNDGQLSVLDIDTHAWLPGTYTVQIISANQTTVAKKLIKI
jgi:hypothetical protein